MNRAEDEQDINGKIDKCFQAIEFLWTENDAIKSALINALQKDNDLKFTEWAEHFQEQLLHTDQVIGVVRHDFAGFLASWKNKDFDIETLSKIFDDLTKDIYKTAMLIKEMKASFNEF